MGNILLPQLIKWALFAVTALVLYGVLPASQLAIVLGLFIAVRVWSLVAEGVRKPLTLQDWQTQTENLAHALALRTPDERAKAALLLGLKQGASARDLAEAQIKAAVLHYVPPRSKRELMAEGLGLAGFAALLPVDAALCTRDFFSVRMPLGWLGAMAAAISILLYALPHFWRSSPRLVFRRMLWWILPFPPALLLFLAAILVKHEYLNPFHPDHKRLAAERVFTLRSIIDMGRHADWVLEYARQLDEEGDKARAAHYYRETLRLDAGNREARVRLAALEGKLAADSVADPGRRFAASSAPYWMTDEDVIKVTRCAIDSRLEQLGECSVVLVAVGVVSDRVLDAVAHAIRKELQLPVLISTNAVPVPEHTRVRGLVTGRQWDHTSLVEAFLSACQPLPKAPVKYLLITPVDIYEGEANYVFSMAYGFGGVLSLARLSYPAGDADPGLCHRAAKQSLCVLLKSFRVPPSPDRECVTSYVRSLEEFDTKGNRPSAQTYALFRQAVAGLNRQWQDDRAKR